MWNVFLVFQVGFTTKDVVYKWISSTSTEAVEQDPGLTTSEFDIGPIRIFESATMYKTGKWTQVMADKVTIWLQKSWLSPHFLSALKLPNNVAYPARLRSTPLLDNSNRKFFRPRNSLDSFQFQWKQLHPKIRITFSKIWLLIPFLYIFRFVFKLKNGTELSKKICVLPDTNLHSQWHDSSVVLGECFLSTVPIKE